MPAAVAIGRVRVRGSGCDPLALRLGVDRLLSAADLRPGRLPPAAILVVRSLADPLPGRLDTRATIAEPRWQRAVAAALDERAARAARPAHGAVPAGAEAVIFADRAELLACAARDLLEGALAERWWWRALRLDSVPDAFLQTPEAVPAAMARLAAAGVAVAFAARVPPPTAVDLVRAMAAAFGALAAAEAALTPPAPDEVAAPLPVPAPSVLARTVASPSTRARRDEPPPWLARVPAAGIALAAHEQQVLVGLALALAHDPAAVRAPAFVKAVRTWRARGATAAEHLAPKPAIAARPRRLSPPPGRPRQARRSSPVAAARPAAAPAPRTRATPPAAAPERATRHAAAPEPAASPERALDVSRAEPVAEAVATRLGGVFHLVYVAQRLGLYGDFATPGAPGIALDVWDFLTLLGRRLLVRPPRDPVWALLAALAGRDPRDVPGGGFAPRTWRVPRAWLEPLPEPGPWRHVEHDGRLVLLHPAGFAAVDAPRASLARALRHYGVAAAVPTAEAIGGAPLERWIAHLAAYLRARLAVALGVPPRRAPRLVLLRPARVLVTDTCVDVVSELAELPIEVRLAGLDRDPGHIPAAGRALRFHFE